MRMRSFRNLLIATALAPAVGGLALVGCDDEEKAIVRDGGSDVMTQPGVDGGGAGTDTAGEGGTPSVCPPAGTDKVVNDNITADTTWDCPSYILKKMTYVVNNATLTIKAGTKIVADVDGNSKRPGLIVSRGSKLIAKGTKELPIVFTSQNNVGARSSGDFAGVVLLGDARLNSGKCSTDKAPPADPTKPDLSTACAAPGFFERNIEGLPATDVNGRYGGSNDENSCGDLSYIRIEFAGAVLQPGVELNGLTLGGCGSATKVSYIQVHRGKDDGVEMFGGTANLDHILVTGDEDDGLDWDFGWRGRAQYVIIHKWVGLVSEDPNGFEGDNFSTTEAASPRSAPQIFNATLIGTPGHRGMTLRRGTRGTLRNMIVQGFGAYPADVLWTQAITPADEWPANLSVENSFFFGNAAFPDETAANDDFGFDEKASFEDVARKNNFAANPTITDVSELAPNYTPTNVLLLGQAVPPAGFDPAGVYAGAVAPNAPSWTVGWTAYPKN